MASLHQGQRKFLHTQEKRVVASSTDFKTALGCIGKSRRPCLIEIHTVSDNYSFNRWYVDVFKYYTLG